MIALRSIATALPGRPLDAPATRAFLADAFSPRLAERFSEAVTASRIHTRHIGPPLSRLLEVQDAFGRNEEYLQRAVPLAEQAIGAALRDAALTPEAIDVLIAPSCTGYALPSLDAMLMNRLPFRADTRRVPLTELGCSAGVGALGLASEMLAFPAHRRALICSVELCSLCLQTGEPSPTDVLSAILFADGAAAAVVEKVDDAPYPEILAAQSVLARDTLGSLGMRLTNGGFRLVLDRELPRIVRRSTRPLVDRFLDAAGVSLADLRFFAIHPGGPRILDAIGAALELPDRVLQPSWEAWEQVGNVSSATVFFILRRLHDHHRPAEGDLGLALAYGPGLSCELALLRWRGGIPGCAADA